MNKPETALSHQLWRDLYSVHWPLPAQVVRRWVPSHLGLDTWEGEAWVSLVAFTVRRARHALLPDGRSHSFDTLDLRTYVEVDGQRGMYLHSLDMSSSRVASAARRALGLPCPRTEMKVRVLGDHVEVRAKEVLRRRPLYFSRARIVGTPSIPSPGSLHEFLTERDALFWSRGPLVLEAGLVRDPAETQPCEVLSIRDDVVPSSGLPVLEGKPAMSHYCRAMDVMVTTPRVRLVRPGIARTTSGVRARVTAA